MDRHYEEDAAVEGSDLPAQFSNQLGTLSMGYSGFWEAKSTSDSGQYPWIMPITPEPAHPLAS